MNKFRLFAVKSLITAICTTGVLLYEKSKERNLIICLVVAIIFDPIVLFYFYFKKLEYKKRFLRKMYDPGHRILVPIIFCELFSIIPFYYLSGYWKVLATNVTSLLVFNALLLFGSSGRKTIQLERNEEFFKIGFLKIEHVEDGDICLNKGEVVQILDHTGGSTVVRKSDGRVFTINESHIDDGIDIVL